MALMSRHSWQVQIRILQRIIDEKEGELKKLRKRLGRQRKKNRELQKEVAFLEVLARSDGREVERLQHELACATGADASHYADGM